MSSLVSPRDRHLKWTGLDWLEALLYILGGACLGGFSIGVLLDVVTREIGKPWLWLQTVNMGFFVYGIFVGMALAVRRNEHMYLSEILLSTAGGRRTALELFSRIVVVIVAICMVVFGWKSVLNDMGRLVPPLNIPFGYYSAAIPIAGMVIVLFSIEQAVNGFANGFDRSSGPTEHRP
jgi:TRAP-type C4-dicarboxylate transport system permease small subunit